MNNLSQRHQLDKIMSEQDAVRTFLKDGDTFTVGGFLLNRESESVFREIARQGQRHLTYIEESCTFGIDLLIGTGAIDRFDQAYIPHHQVGGILGLPMLNRCLHEGDPRPVDMGGVMATPSDRSDQEPFKLVDWTNFMVSLRFVAGSMNLPYMPCRSGIGTDIPKYNKEIIISEDPFEHSPIALIPACKPDVAFISVQRADRRGNGQVFGYKGVDEWKARAAKHVVLLTEELVSTEKISENPANTVVPAYCTDAVVELPFHNHPYGIYGCYATDRIMLTSHLLARQSREGFQKWMDEWVYGCRDHFEYNEKIGLENLEELRLMEQEINQLP